MPVEDDESIKEVLGLDPIAVIGCSRKPGKAARDVPTYLRSHGYEIFPVNPNASEIFGRAAADSLSDLSDAVSLVTVFRPSDEVAGIVDEVLNRHDVKAIWCQLGIRDDDAMRRAENSGLVTVQDRCMKIEHARLFGN